MSNQVTNFNSVREFHQVFEHPINDKPGDILTNEKMAKLVKLRLDLIREEFAELEDAINKKDIVEVADALSDLLYVVHGCGLAFGIDLDDTFKRVHASNMTKACLTEQEAIDTVEHIKKTQPRYTNPQYKKSADEKFYIVFDKDSGKILKSINYTPVDLSHIAKL